MKITYFLVLALYSLSLLADSYTEGLDLSDEDRRQLQNYSSDSYNQQALEELCDIDKDDDGEIDNKNIDVNPNISTTLADACKGKSVKTFGVDEQTIGAISKAYSQFSLMMSVGGNSSLISSSTSSAPAAGTTGAAGSNPAAQASGKNKSDFDYCAILGAGAEQLSAYQQNQYQQHLASIPTNAQNAQTDGLIKVKQQYREKAKNQELNSIGWSGSAVCYAGKMTSGASAFDLKTVLKFSAAGLLGVYNGFSAKNHRNLADELNVVIQKMPRNGDCNPITDTHCYCNLPENLNDEKYCLPEIRARASRKYGTQVACLDKYGRPDGDCDCIARNNCFDVTYMNTLDGISFSESIDDGSKKTVSQLSRGTLGKSNKLETGNLSNNAVSKLKNALKKISNQTIEGVPPLSSEQKKEARIFHKLGLPKNLAAALASAPKPSAQMLAKARKQFQPSKSSWNKKRNKSRTQSFNNSNNFSMTNNDKKSGRNSGFNIKSMMKKRGLGGNSSGKKVENYASKARAKASISTKSGVSIFRIISRRYQLTQDERLK